MPIKSTRRNRSYGPAYVPSQALPSVVVDREQPDTLSARAAIYKRWLAAVHRAAGLDPIEDDPPACLVESISMERLQSMEARWRSSTQSSMRQIPVLSSKLPALAFGFDAMGTRDSIRRAMAKWNDRQEAPRRQAAQDAERAAYRAKSDEADRRIQEIMARWQADLEKSSQRLDEILNRGRTQ